jgi:hypothetical protein
VDQPKAQRQHDGGNAIGAAELLTGVLYVKLYRVVADIHDLPNLPG